METDWMYYQACIELANLTKIRAFDLLNVYNAFQDLWTFISDSKLQ